MFLFIMHYCRPSLCKPLSKASGSEISHSKKARENFLFCLHQVKFQKGIFSGFLETTKNEPNIVTYLITNETVSLFIVLNSIAWRWSRD